MSTLTTEDFRRGGAAYPSTWHFDKDLPEDRKHIEKTFKVLREYSGIPADKVEEHVITIVRRFLSRGLEPLRMDQTFCPRSTIIPRWPDAKANHSVLQIIERQGMEGLSIPMYRVLALPGRLHGRVSGVS
jgi:hypothetical protein